MVSFGFDESTTLQARNPNPSPSPGSSMLQPWLQPETRWRRSTSRRSRGRSSGGPARTRRSALGGSDAFGHPGRPVGLGSRAARAPIRTRAPYFAADAGVSSSAAGARRLPKVSRRAVGAARAARRSRRSDRKAGRSPRQVASAGAGAVLSLPTARCWRARGALPVQARAGTGAQGADVTSLVGTSCQLFSSHARSIGAPTSTSLPCPPARGVAPLPYLPPSLDALCPP